MNGEPTEPVGPGADPSALGPRMILGTRASLVALIGGLLVFGSCGMAFGVWRLAGTSGPGTTPPIPAPSPSPSASAGPSPSPTSTPSPTAEPAPDLTVADLAGDSVTVANIGTADAGRFVVTVSGRAFIVDGGVVAGSSTTVSFDCRTGPLTATVDSTDRVVELDETNNARTAGPFDCASPTPSPSPTAPPSVTPTQPPSMPDLTVSGLFADGVRVRNQGDAAAGTFVVGVTGVGTFTVKSLGPGQSVFLAFPCSAGTLTATADARHQVAESDEGNNVRSGGPFTCLPDLIVAELTGSTVTLMNIGVGPAGPSIVTIGGLVLQVPSLDPNGAVQLRYKCIGGTVTAFADANDDVTESNESNNTLTKDVGIC